jgi:sugar phosphate permease
MSENGTLRAWLSGIGAILMSLASMGPFVMISLYMNSMAADLNVTVGQISVALSISTIGSMVAGLTIGGAMKRLNHRLIILIAAVCVFAVQFTISVSTSLIPIYIVIFLNGFGTMWGGMAMAQIAITQWFAKGQGTMMSACMIVMSLVLAICIPIVGAQVAAHGYRPVVMVVGVIAAIGVAISAFLVSAAPEKYGVLPFGAGKGNAKSGDQNASTAAAIPSLSWKGIRKSAVFWVIFAIVVLGAMVCQGFNSQAAVIFGTLGLDESSAAFAFSLFTLVGIPSQFVFGFLCDRAGPKWALTVCGGISAIVLLLAFMWSGWVGAVIIACGMAIGAGLAGLYGPNAAPRIFGPREAGEMVGFISVASALGSTIGPLAFGFMYDGFGSYSVALTVMGVVLVVCLLLNFWAHNKPNISGINKQIESEVALSLTDSA